MSEASVTIVDSVSSMTFEWQQPQTEHCKKPTFFDLNGVQHPGVAYGNAVDALPQDIAGLYDEARRAYAAGAYTAAVLACRKILMNIAVAKGAAEGEPFIVYVKHLADTATCRRMASRLPCAPLRARRGSTRRRCGG